MEQIIQNTGTQSGPELVKDAMDIATGKKEAPTPIQQTATSVQEKPSTTEQKPQETKKEGEPAQTSPLSTEETKAEVDKIRKDYEVMLEKERKEKSGIYRDLKEQRKKLQQIQQQPPAKVQPVQTQPANVDTYINNATTALKEIGFSDKNIEDLKDRAVDDPFAVISAISYAITNHIKDKTLKEVYATETSAETKELDEKEKNLISEVNKGWETSREKLAQKHPDMIKKGADGKWVIDEKSPKFITYDDEAKKALQEEPWLQFSPNFAELVAQRMEMRLLQDKSFQEGQKAEQQRQADVEAGFVATGGRQLPPKTKITLTSEEEAQADKDIRRGLFKNYEEWAQTKNQRVV